MRAAIRGKSMKVAICDRCGQKWGVSAQTDTSRMYICPKCEAQMEGRRWYHGTRPERNR